MFSSFLKCHGFLQFIMFVAWLDIHVASVLGDKAFAEFLSDEINEEKKIKKHQSLPKMSGGWDIERNGTEAKLIRTLAGEK